MRRTMKKQIRVLGIDDSPFRFGDQKALVVGALVRVPSYLEGVLRTEVAVDGTDSTRVIIDTVAGSRFKDQVKLIMLDGIALAGFNVVDIDAIHGELGIPVLTVTRDRPDFEKMRSALQKYFEDWEERYRLMTKHQLRELPTSYNPVYACGVGLEWRELAAIVRATTVRGVVPEPLRIAHLVASAMVKGESYGRS